MAVQGGISLELLGCHARQIRAKFRLQGQSQVQKVSGRAQDIESVRIHWWRVAAIGHCVTRAETFELLHEQPHLKQEGEAIEK
jgi:hypothetical protein